MQLFTNCSAQPGLSVIEEFNIITERKAVEADLYSLNLRGNCLAVVYSLVQK